MEDNRKNYIDNLFYKLIDEILYSSDEQLMYTLKKKLYTLKHDHPNIYNTLISYYSKYGFWGMIDEPIGDYENFDNRINVLKNHAHDFLWLYNKLEDYTSKYTLFTILLNWKELNTAEIVKVESIYPQYFDLDLFPSNENEVFVDCGAYIGDTLANYINTYGRNYNKYYAYEMNENCLNTLNKTISENNIENVIVKNYGVGEENSTLFIDENESATKISDDGSKEVKVIKLDEDLDSIPTYIKMDIEGYEEKAILGSQYLIKTYKPKLAISVYHGYDDLWKLPQLINEINPNYKFYLRHHGGNLVPTEFILYCK